MKTEKLIELARSLPKAELHIHIEGSLEPELIFQLAQRNKIGLRYDSVEALRSAYAFKDLQSFLDIYYAGASVLITELDFYDMTWAYLQRAAADKIVRAEIFFDPQTHTERGVAMATVMRGLKRACVDAKSKLGVDAELILCFLRHLSEDAAFATLEEAKPFLGDFIGVGLDSSELGHPPSKFQRVFAQACGMGLRAVAHAGEEGPPAYVWEALELLKAERIDHGVQSTKDAKLMAHLAAKRIPLTVCPLSNEKLCVFDKLSDHNLKALLNSGLCAMINSDDPAYFGGYLGTNFERCIAELPLDEAEVVQLMKNSFEASFLPSEAKRQWLRNF
jgi:adenosine deaminase